MGQDPLGDNVWQGNVSGGVMKTRFWWPRMLLRVLWLACCSQGAGVSVGRPWPSADGALSDGDSIWWNCVWNHRCAQCWRCNSERSQAWIKCFGFVLSFLKWQKRCGFLCHPRYFRILVFTRKAVPALCFLSIWLCSLWVTSRLSVNIVQRNGCRGWKIQSWTFSEPGPLTGQRRG